MRLKMVQSLMSFRTQVQKRPTDDLIPIHRKLQEIVAKERVKESGAESIEEVVGKIDPRESGVIQQYRRKLRLMGKKYATERAYVGKVKAFMRERALKCMADFANTAFFGHCQGDLSAGSLGTRQSEPESLNSTV